MGGRLAPDAHSGRHHSSPGAFAGNACSCGAHIKGVWPVWESRPLAELFLARRCLTVIRGLSLSRSPHLSHGQGLPFLVSPKRTGQPRHRLGPACLGPGDQAPEALRALPTRSALGFAEKATPLAAAPLVQGDHSVPAAPGSGPASARPPSPHSGSEALLFNCPQSPRRAGLAPHSCPPAPSHVWVSVHTAASSAPGRRGSFPGTEPLQMLLPHARPPPPPVSKLLFTLQNPAPRSLILRLSVGGEGEV